MKKILLSLSMVAAIAVVVVGATGAFFSDTETSEGNIFTAGAIDLGIDNRSYYNGLFNEGTSWLLTYDLDLDGPHFFFNFDDIKPGDWGEDTISLHVNNNDAWVCADVTLTSDNENDVVEPEDDLGDTAPDGELASHVTFIWWADDGDNVLEDDEQVISGGPLGALGVGNTATVTIADANNNIFTGQPNDPIVSFDGEDEIIRYIGKAWCFGDITLDPVEAGEGQDPTVDPGFSCDGEGENNITQTDSMTADISFRAVQSRNNEEFTCNEGPQGPVVT
jgi:predicted ribosomally synthesized peptide with SipW-like signal peptide